MARTTRLYWPVSRVLPPALCWPRATFLPLVGVQPDLIPPEIAERLRERLRERQAELERSVLIYGAGPC